MLGVFALMAYRRDASLHFRTCSVCLPRAPAALNTFGIVAPSLRPNTVLRYAEGVKPEVEPAGYWPQLRAAIDAGADAVYFGLKHFTARAKVGFSSRELPEGCAHCTRELKVFVTQYTGVRSRVGKRFVPSESLRQPAIIALAWRNWR
jgi:hypothetical protein